MTSWKTFPVIWRKPPGYKLQWGHDFDVVEDEARRRERGVWAEGYKLQWGHDFDVVEDP